MLITRPSDASPRLAPQLPDLREITHLADAFSAYPTGFEMGSSGIAALKSFAMLVGRRKGACPRNRGDRMTTPVRQHRPGRGRPTVHGTVNRRVEPPLSPLFHRLTRLQPGKGVRGAQRGGTNRGHSGQQSCVIRWSGYLNPKQGAKWNETPQTRRRKTQQAPLQASVIKRHQLLEWPVGRGGVTQGQ
jgi:hypothetical protein